MTCRSKIWTNAAILTPVRQSLANQTSIVWHRVTDLPDYVYFNHAIHVAKGVGCASCHGNVQAYAADGEGTRFQYGLLPGVPP
jgi:hypothetical protein